MPYMARSGAELWWGYPARGLCIGRGYMEFFESRLYLPDVQVDGAVKSVTVPIIEPKNLIQGL
jgi:hypothetical protein